MIVADIGQAWWGALHCSKQFTKVNSFKPRNNLWGAIIIRILQMRYIANNKHFALSIFTIILNKKCTVKQS